MAPKNFYNLPPPWNPGYAIPQSVMDEGLHRQAFITAQQPRGTYDAVQTGSAGYAIPQYVLAEKTGRGTFTTKWLPRGYYGPKVPHWLDDLFAKVVGKKTLPNGETQTTMETLSGLDGSRAGRGSLANPWVQYGQRSAKAILSHLRRFPPPSQPLVLKTMLDAIDTSLFGKVKRACEVAVGQGVPPNRALEVALSSSMTKGVLDELVKMGRSRSMPQPRSLLGLGIYGASRAFGDTWTTGASGGQGTGGVITPVQTPWVVEASGGGGTGQIALTRLLQVGPFVFSDQDGATIRVTPATTTQEITKVVSTALGKGASSYIGLNSTVAGSGYGGPAGSSTTAQSIEFAKNAFGDMFGGGSGKIPAVLVNGTMPIFWFKHPTTGRLWAVRVSKIGNSSSPGYSVTIRDDGNAVSRFLDGLTELIAKIIEIAKALADKLGDIACDTLNKPGGAAAATAAAGPYGAAGAIAASALCKPGAPPPPLPEAPSLLVPLAIGGAALVALALITKKKRSTP